MADAVVTVLKESNAEPNNPAKLPTKSYTVVFDGNTLQSQIIDIDRFRVMDINAFGLTAVAVSLGVLGSHDGTNFELVAADVVDLTVGKTGGTTLLAGYRFARLLQGAAQAGEVQLGLI